MRFKENVVHIKLRKELNTYLHVPLLVDIPIAMIRVENDTTICIQGMLG